MDDWETDCDVIADTLSNHLFPNQSHRKRGSERALANYIQSNSTPTSITESRDQRHANQSRRRY